MDIKATQLKNNTQIAETASTAVRTPAKPTEEGKSFVDAMCDLPKIDTDSKAVQNVSVEVEDKPVVDKNNKSFEFISKSDKDFNFNSVQNKESMTVEERQARHKVAEKELVDEIVLMNNKHNSDIKNLDKNEFKKSEIATAQKSDKQIETENFDVMQDMKFVSKSENVLAENNSKKSEISEVTNNLVNLEKEVKQDNFEILKSDIPNSEIELLPQNISEPEVLKIAEGEVEEILLPDKNVKEELFLQPEVLEKFEEPKIIEKIAPVETEQVAKDDKVEVIGKLASEEINIKDKNIAPKPSKAEDKSFKDVGAIKSEKADVKPLNVEVKPSKAEEKTSEVKNIELNDKKINIAENNVKPERVLQDKPSVKPSKVENAEVRKSDEVKIQKMDAPKVNAVAENEVIQEVKTFEKPEKVAFVENLINQNKIDEKKDLKNDKPSLSRISSIKKDVLNEVENVGKVKDIADEVKVSAVEMKPVIPQDIKVIKMEVVNPLADLNNSLNTTKTSDIVKFIDANLSTDNVKSTKTNASKAASSAKKASSEKSIKMTEADAKFFNNLIETNQQVIEGTKTADQTNNNLLKDVESAKSAQVSKTLLNALKESQENNKAFRVDFDKDISVVLRVNKDGHISAEFLPGDEAVEQYLKANIPLLKQKFSDEGLEYDNLSYRQQKKENEEKERQHKGNKKENGYE